MHNLVSLLPGTVIKLIYFTILERRRKVFKFSGLCIAKKKKSNFILLRNNFLKESFEMGLDLNSPYLLTATEDNSFTFKKTFKKLYYRKNIRIYTMLGQQQLKAISKQEKFYFTDFLFIFDFFFRLKNKRYIRYKYRLRGR